MTKTVTMDTTNEFAQILVDSTFKLIEGRCKTVKQTNHVTTVFIARFMGTLLYKSLTHKPDTVLSKEQLVKFTTNNFSEMKTSVQEAIAAAFSGAMHTFTKIPIEYYCQVKPVPPAINKEPI